MYVAKALIPEAFSIDEFRKHYEYYLSNKDKGIQQHL